MMMIANMPGPSSSSPCPPPPKRKPNCRIIAATEAKNDAIVMIITSRCLTCASSGGMTPSSSEGEARLRERRGGRGEERRDRHDHHVAVLDVRELVRHDALELGGGQQVHDP